jgi:hypothetical protein
MGPFSFFALVIATFTLSSAALLLGGMVTERKPKRSASAVRVSPVRTSAVRTSAVQRGHSSGAGEILGYPSPLSGARGALAPRDRQARL